MAVGALGVLGGNERWVLGTLGDTGWQWVALGSNGRWVLGDTGWHWVAPRDGCL